MKLAIFHYHLNRGGVTRVIENQLLALDAVLDPADPWTVAVVYGGRREGWNDALESRLRAVRLSLVEVPLLDYDPEVPAFALPGSDHLFDAVSSLLEEQGFIPKETLLHVHNHALGKNRAWPSALRRLAEAGYATLLQIHDFAEDFRPKNYRRLLEAIDGEPSRLYPQAPGIHYAVLNDRDHAILKEAGVASDHLHLVLNPVPPMDGLPPVGMAREKLHTRCGVKPDECFMLYPVRCIRRKNVGEALLHATLAPPGTVVGLTLAPLNPAEVPIYRMWKDLAAELTLPCRFEVGAPGALCFQENLAAADRILTTSLAEGFGMVFLESWVAGRPLVGRDLPEITADFTRAGVRFDWLTSRVNVPVRWIGAETFCQSVARAYRQTLLAYGRQAPEGLDEAVAVKIVEETIDFGDLDETGQEQVLRRVISNPSEAECLLELNPGLARAFSLDSQTMETSITQNVQIIENHYSLTPSGLRLVRLYRQVMDSTRGGRAEPLAGAPRILDRFLDLERFRLIRS